MTQVVTCQEMTRLEELAIAAGHSAELLMERAGAEVATLVATRCKERAQRQKISLLIGPGNNGGDAYAAGIHLLRDGYPVTAYRWHSSRTSPLNRLYADRFLACGGQILPPARLTSHDFLIDGLLGTGCHGELEASLLDWIREVNQSGAFVLSIDIPSGIHGTSGAGVDSAIHAHETVTLGLPKLGLFLRGAWEAVGRLTHVDIGLTEWMTQVQAAAEWVTGPEVVGLLPRMSRCRHKYQAGLVVGMGGSLERPGAAKLAAYAALRGGAGLVHLFFPKGVQEEMRDLPFEVMKEVWNVSRFQEALRRARACFVGPGLGRSRSVQKWLTRYVPTISVPTVLDADALYFLRELTYLPQEVIVTPHRGELGRFLSYKEEDFITSCADFAQERRLTLLVKGAPTFVFGPRGIPHIVTAGDPGMATAGAGDVLTGLIAALLAQGLKPFEAALLGAYLHGLAGESAARIKTSYSLIASDLIEEFSSAFQKHHQR